MKPMKAYAHATQVDWIGVCIALRELKSVLEKKKQKERRKDVLKKPLELLMLMMQMLMVEVVKESLGSERRVATLPPTIK